MKLQYCPSCKVVYLDVIACSGCSGETHFQETCDVPAEAVRTQLLETLYDVVQSAELELPITMGWESYQKVVGYNDLIRVLRERLGLPT